MDKNVRRLWGVVLLAVIAGACLHSYVDRDHLRLEPRPAGVALSRVHSVERDSCLCFTHGLFIPEFSVPADHARLNEATLFLPAEVPLTLAQGGIDHPPLA